VANTLGCAWTGMDAAKSKSAAHPNNRFVISFKVSVLN